MGKKRTAHRGAPVKQEPAKLFNPEFVRVIATDADLVAAAKDLDDMLSPVRELLIAIGRSKHPGAKQLHVTASEQALTGAHLVQYYVPEHLQHPDQFIFLIEGEGVYPLGSQMAQYLMANYRQGSYWDYCSNLPARVVDRKRINNVL